MTNAPPLCGSTQAVTADWLRRALAAGGAGGVPPIRDVEVEDLASATNAFGELLRCRLTTDAVAPGVPETVIVKMPTVRASAARFARRLALHQREYVFYRHLARHVRIRTPALLYGDWDERSDRFVLVLEDLRAMTTVSQLDGIAGAHARRAVLELAGLHGQYWNKVDHPHLSRCHEVLSPADGRFLRPAVLHRGHGGVRGHLGSGGPEQVDAADARVPHPAGCRRRDHHDLQLRGDRGPVPTARTGQVSWAHRRRVRCCLGGGADPGWCRCRPPVVELDIRVHRPSRRTGVGAGRARVSQNPRRRRRSSAGLSGDGHSHPRGGADPARAVVGWRPASGARSTS